MSKFASTEFGNRQYYVCTGLVYPSQRIACMSRGVSFSDRGQGRKWRHAKTFRALLSHGQ